MTSKTKPTADAPTIVLHWGMVATLVVSLATGLRFAADDPDAAVAGALNGVLPQGEVVTLHIWSATLLLALSIAYVVFLFRARLQARVALDKHRLSDLRKGGRNWWASANVAVYWLAFLAILGASVTGLALYFMPGRIATAPWLVVHEWLSLSIPAYILLHIVALVGVGGVAYLLKIFRPKPAYGAALFVAASAGAAVAAVFFGADQASTNRLEAAYAKKEPILDGKSDDAVWENAKAVEIPTMRGANLPDGDVSVTVRAAYNDTHFFGLFQWPDSTRSFKHLPMVKTEDGWKVQQTEFGIQDEDSYYEDKFGVMLTKGGGLAGDGSIHLGPQPLDGHPGPSGGRGLHYTTDGSIVDVWHWKAVRTGNPAMQQIDDNFFGAPMEPKAKGRYTGGYDKDPKTGGGFLMNWEAYSDDVVTPKFLPRDPASIERFQSVDLSPDAGDDEGLFLLKSEAVPYDPALDTYPVGTVLPAVVVDAPFEGDRGDVSAAAHWEDGMWTLEVRRALDTGSEYDLPISTSKPTYLWVAVFDHAQTRHSMQLRPVELALR